MSTFRGESGGWPLREHGIASEPPERPREEIALAAPADELPLEEQASEAAQPLGEAAPAVEEAPEGDEEGAAIEVEEPQPEHAEGALVIPEGRTVLEGTPTGARRSVAVVVSRFNGEITNRLLASALEELEAAGVSKDAVTIVPVPGAFELPLAAIALAKTRRYACIVALGCVIRGETPHFDFVAGEAASGLQLAAIETGVPVSFGLLTCETAEQAEARVGKGAEAVRASLEMADLFARLRASVVPTQATG